MITDIDTFFAQTTNLTEAQWQQLIEAELYTLDWPPSAGGLNWERSEKLEFTKRLIDAGCPLFPESLTLTAPLLIRTERTALLAELQTHINDAQLIVTDDNISLLIDSDLHEIATGDQVDCQLSMAFSPLYQIYELRSTLLRILVMNDYWQNDIDPQLTGLNIELEALETLYLRNDEITDLQIALKCNTHQLASYNMLFQAMGYYALLDPDPVLSANEHVPFLREREHLRRLRSLVGRSEVIQQDQIFSCHLDVLP